jgi:hypothetical protein
MFEKTKKVIYIGESEIKGAVVELEKSPEIKSQFRIELKEGNLKEALTEAVRQLGAKKIYLLLGKDMTYVLHFSLPAETPAGESERSEILKYIKGEIPEEPEDDEWDYKIIKRDKKERSAVAFVPVLSKFEQITKILGEINCEVTAMEPEEVAVTRHPDPIIGIALKEDERGKDEDSLNLKLQKAEEPEEIKTNEEGVSMESVTPTKKGIRKEYIYAPVITLVVGLVLVGGILVSRKATKPEEIEQTAIEVTPTQTVTPTPEIIDLARYSVQVQNGSGIAGQAAALGEILKNGGFEKIETANSDNYDYEGVMVRSKTGTGSAELLTKVSEILSDYKTTVGENLGSDAVYDLIIIVGK